MNFQFTIFKLLVIILSGLSPVNYVAAQVVLNEIAWMGTESSANDEWIELRNETDNPINLDGWTIKADDGTPLINLTNEIPAKGFYLLERTDDSTIPEITADLIYKGALGNSGENLKLYNSSGNLIDEASFSSGWPAGDNTTKQTMERINSNPGSRPLSWQTSQNYGGTPKAENSGPVELAESPIPSISEEPFEEPAPETLVLEQGPQEEIPAKPEVATATSTTEEPKLSTITTLEPEIKSTPIAYASGILINEILASAEGPDETEEWIELKNLNPQKVNLSQWQIQDVIGSITSYTFPAGTEIEANGFLILGRPETKITLNNSGDEVLLVQPDGNVLDRVSYEKAPLGQSYNRTDTGWVWSAVLTPGSANAVAVPAPGAKTIQSSGEKDEAATKIPSDELGQKQLAAIGEQIPKSTKSWPLFLIASGLAIFSGFIILFLKKRAQQKE